MDRRGLEAALRRRWRRRPGPGWRLAGAGFRLASDLRNLLYEAGVLAERRASLPVVSVGGLTVGGSGKTPIAAEVGRWLTGRGLSVAVVTPGHPDEMEVHRRLNPAATVLGGRDRGRAVARAAAGGARVAVLDDGFQHRRLARELDILLVDADAMSRTNRRALPAGPFRDRFAEVGRAGVVVVSRRDRRAAPAARLSELLARRLSDTTLGRCRLAPGAPVPANAAAGSLPRAQPAVAVAGIMKPRLFFAQVRSRWPGLGGVRTFPDHAGPDPRELESLLAAAGDRGLVCTLKDAVGLEPRIGNRTPLWILADEVRWEEGEEAVRARVAEVCPSPAG